MSFLKSLFNKKDDSIFTYHDFWDWFVQNEAHFHQVVKEQNNIESEFLDPMTHKLKELREGFWFLTGMKEENISELVFTPDGIVKNIVFVEELVAAAPQLEHWEFTALKPPMDIHRLFLEMQNFNFSQETLSFYAIDHPDYPDEIDLVVVHDEYNKENEAVITNGTFIFLDNYLGELKTVTMIDNLRVTSKEMAEKDLIPIAKLKDYLTWREKEFIEKYDGVRHSTEDDGYALFEATLENDLPLLATINTQLLQWDSKASHPWIAVVQIQYDGKNNNGMPDEKTYELLNNIEDDITSDLKDNEGYLYIGRETVDSVREIYFACVDFRKPSKVLDNIQKTYKDKLEINFDIYKDKYWRSFNRYSNHL